MLLGGYINSLISPTKEVNPAVGKSDALASILHPSSTVAVAIIRIYFLKLIKSLPFV